MLSSIKAFYEKIKDVLAYVITPIVGLLVYIYFLLQKEQGLENQVGTLKADKELGDVLAKKQEAEKQAKDAIDTYNKLKAGYTGDQK